MLYKFVCIYFVFISLVSVVITIYDKVMAVRHKYRIPEKTLLIFSAMGGSLAMYITMQMIRHKTKKLKFTLGIPVIMILQIVLLLLVYYLI